MLRLSAASALKACRHAQPTAATTIGPPLLLGDGLSSLFLGLPFEAANIPWCTGQGSIESCPGGSQSSSASAAAEPSVQPPCRSGMRRSHAVQSRRHFTGAAETAAPSGSMQAGSQNGMFPVMMMATPAPWSTCGAADLGQSLARASSLAERAGAAGTHQERSAIVERLQRELAERGLTGGGVSSASSASSGEPPLAAALQMEAQMKDLIGMGRYVEAARHFDPRLLLQVHAYAAANICDELLRACSHLPDSDLAQQVVQSMHGLGIPCGYKAHSYVLRALCSAGKHEAAIEYLVEDLPVGKNKDNVGFMYNIILSSALYHKKPDIIIRVLDLMSENSIPRSAHTWVLVFNSLGQAGDAAGVQSCWQQVKGPLRDSLAVQAAMVSALAACSQISQAADALRQTLGLYAGTLQRHSTHAGASDGTAASARGSKEGSEAVESLRDAEKGLRQACHVIIHAAERARQPDLAHSILVDMHKVGLQPDTAVYNSVLRLVAAEERFAPAALEEVMADMVSRGVRPDRRSYFLLLQAHARHADLDGAKRVLQRMARDGIAPDRFTYNALLEAHAAANDLEGAAKIYDAMCAKQITPDICTFISLFQAVKSAGPLERPMSVTIGRPQGQKQSWLSHMRGLGRANAADLLSSWLDDLDASGLRHTPSSFTALVQALGHTCLIEPMLELIAAAWESSHLPHPSLYACNAAVAACARVGRLNEAMDLYRDMERHGLQPDMHTFTALIGGCAYARQAGLAHQLFEEVRRRGLRPSTYTYNALIKAECHVGNLEKGMHLVDVMAREGVRHDDATWHTLLSAAKHLARPDAAEMILERMTGVTDEWTKPSVAYPEPVHLTFQDPDVPGAEQGAEGRDDPGLGQSRWNDDDDDDDMFGGPRY